MPSQRQNRNVRRGRSSSASSPSARNNRNEYYGGGKFDASPYFAAWREAQSRARAAAQRQGESKGYKQRDVVLADGSVSPQYVVPAGRVKQLAQQIYRSDDFRAQHGDLDIKKQRPARQSPADRAKRVHGMSLRDLHRPVTRSEAIKLFLEGYRRQAQEGHVVNQSGTRTYSKSKVTGWDKKTGKPIHGADPRAGSPIPRRVVKDFKHPGQALRSRMNRVAGKSPDAKGRVSGRQVVNACPEGVSTRKQAEDAKCADSWKLRQRNAWKRYQVEDVSLFDSSDSAKSSDLYRYAGRLGSTEKRAKRARSKSPKKSPGRKGPHPKGVQPAWLKGVPRRKKGQSPESYRGRHSEWAAKYGHPYRQGQTVDQYRSRRRLETEAARASKRAPAKQQSHDSGDVDLEDDE